MVSAYDWQSIDIGEISMLRRHRLTGEKKDSLSAVLTHHKKLPSCDFFIHILAYFISSRRPCCT
jgi:hypothetical protein